MRHFHAKLSIDNVPVENLESVEDNFTRLTYKVCGQPAVIVKGLSYTMGLLSGPLWLRFEGGGHVYLLDLERIEGAPDPERVWYPRSAFFS